MSETKPVQPPTVPESFRPDALPPEDTSKWPRVIGLISLFYALGGMLCSIAMSVWTAFIGTFMASLMDVEVGLPTPVKVAYLALGAANLILGVMMLVGAVALLRRRRSGVTLLLRWAVLRMGLLLIGAVVNVLTVPSQIELQKTMMAAGNEQRVVNDMEPAPIPSDAELHRNMIIQTAVVTGLFAVYPMFLGFYLSRRKVRAQIEHWPSR